MNRAAVENTITGHSRWECNRNFFEGTGSEDLCQPGDIHALLLDCGLIDQHDRDIIPDGIDSFALGTLQTIALSGQAN